MPLADGSAVNNTRQLPNTIIRQITFSWECFEALVDVYHGKVRFRNGLPGAAFGYTWCSSDAPVPESKQQTLRKLWCVDYIDIEMHLLVATYGHDVRLTHRGYQQLLSWGYQPERKRVGKQTVPPTD